MKKISLQKLLTLGIIFLAALTYVEYVIYEDDRSEELLIEQIVQKDMKFGARLLNAQVGDRIDWVEERINGDKFMRVNSNASNYFSKLNVYLDSLQNEYVQLRHELENCCKSENSDVKQLINNMIDWLEAAYRLSSVNYKTGDSKYGKIKGVVKRFLPTSQTKWNWRKKLHQLTEINELSLDWSWNEIQVGMEMLYPYLHDLRGKTYFEKQMEEASFKQRKLFLAELEMTLAKINFSIVQSMIYRGFYCASEFNWDRILVFQLPDSNQLISASFKEWHQPVYTSNAGKLSVDSFGTATLTWVPQQPGQFTLKGMACLNNDHNIYPYTDTWSKTMTVIEKR